MKWRLNEIYKGMRWMTKRSGLKCSTFPSNGRADCGLYSQLYCEAGWWINVLFSIVLPVISLFLFLFMNSETKIFWYLVMRLGSSLCKSALDCMEIWKVNGKGDYSIRKEWERESVGICVNICPTSARHGDGFRYIRIQATLPRRLVFFVMVPQVLTNGIRAMPWT